MSGTLGNTLKFYTQPQGNSSTNIGGVSPQNGCNPDMAATHFNGAQTTGHNSTQFLRRTDETQA